MSDLSELDTLLLDPAWYADDRYLEGFKRLRDEDPVHWTVDPRYGKDYWALTRYDDIEQYLLNDRMLSSRWDTHVPPTPERITPEFRYSHGFDAGMSFLDNPMHDLYRRPMNKHFSVPAIGKLTGLAESAIDEILAEAVAEGTTDIIPNLSLAIPTRIVLRWFGVPEADWEHVQHGVSGSGRGFSPNAGETSTHNEIWDYSEAIARDRMENPRDDFLTTLVTSKIDGTRLSLHEATSIVFLLFEGALGNTRNAIAWGVWLLIDNPDQAALLREDPSLAGSATDEVLRYASNSPTRLRIANEDFDLGGKFVSAGDWVVAFTKSANFDERQFEDPERFDITRRPKHLGFGAGIHNCLGRHLARLEMSILFRKLVQEYEFGPAEAPTWGIDSPGSKIPARMPITFARKPKSAAA